MSRALKHAVSKSKRRYADAEGFDLDLSYITDRVIAMGFPSEGMEAVYRNPYAEVYRFLESRHQDHYKVYNLCSERGYELSKFHDRVGLFPFDDHNAPPFELIEAFCKDVKEYLDEDPENVVAVHCKAGKGRTGLMICCWLVYGGDWPTADEAMRFYAAMRTHNQKGVTIPSQIRYVHYFAKQVADGRAPERRTVLLTNVILHTIPVAPNGGDLRFTVYVYKTPVFSWKGGEKTRKILKAAEKKQKALSKQRKTQEKRAAKEGSSEAENAGNAKKRDPTLDFVVDRVPLFGDIKIDFYEKVQLFQVWFNTGFIENNRVIFTKPEIDKANKDKSCKVFAPNFRVELRFQPAEDEQSATTPRIATVGGVDSSTGLAYSALRAEHPSLNNF